MTPKECGLRVRAHTEGLLVTALNKSRYTKSMRLSFAGRLVQSKYLLTDATSREKNATAVKTFISSLESTERRGSPPLWNNVAADKVCSFLRSLAVPAKDVDADGDRLAKFIERQLPLGGLTTWSVLLAGTGDNDHETFLEGLKPVIRKPARPADECGQKLPPAVAMRKANILNPPDQYADFEGRKLTLEYFEEIRTCEVFTHGGNGEDLEVLKRSIGRGLVAVATEISQARHAGSQVCGESPRTPNGGVVRDLRQRSHALLIIYPTMAARRTATLPGLRILPLIRVWRSVFRATKMQSPSSTWSTRCLSSCNWPIRMTRTMSAKKTFEELLAAGGNAPSLGELPLLLKT
jgi:hypothetical protein